VVNVDGNLTLRSEAAKTSTRLFMQRLKVNGIWFIKTALTRVSEAMQYFY